MMSPILRASEMAEQPQKAASEASRDEAERPATGLSQPNGTGAGVGKGPRTGALRARGIFLVLAALGSLTLALGSLVGLRCESCHRGLLSLCLPWGGALFYSGLAVLAARRPHSKALALAPGFFLFAHACLVAEMLLLHRPCVGCFAVASLAAGAGASQLFLDPREWAASALAVVLGSVAGFLLPFDRSDDFMTRKLWPAKRLEEIPAWVDRSKLVACAHRVPIRMLIFEKDCKS